MVLSVDRTSAQREKEFAQFRTMRTIPRAPSLRFIIFDVEHRGFSQSLRSNRVEEEMVSRRDKLAKIDGRVNSKWQR